MSVSHGPQRIAPPSTADPTRLLGITVRQISKLNAGIIIHFDFGVKYEEYCSDIQRVAYVFREGETEAPAEVQRGFITIRTAIEKSREAMKAGVTGNSIDVIAREIVTDSGYPEYPYALGHQLGRVAHDGGACWVRFGRNMAIRQIKNLKSDRSSPSSPAWR